MVCKNNIKLEEGKMNRLKYDLEDGISLGYQWIEKIEEEYKNPPNGGLVVVLDKYYRLVANWEEQVKRTLPNDSRRRAFSLAKNTDPMYESGKSIDIQNLIKNVRAKISVLENYTKEEFSQTPFVLSGQQNRAYINSEDNSVNVITGNFVGIVKELEVEFQKNYQGKDKAKLLELVKTLEGKDEDAKGARKILGKLLTRGAEISQVTSLIIQLLQFLPK